MSHITYLSWGALFAGFLAWGCVVWFALIIADADTARASSQNSAQQTSAKQTSDLRTHSLALETSNARAQIEAVAGADVVSIVDTINAVGADAGVRIKIGQALSAPGTKGDTLLRTVSFIVEVEGDFASVMQAASLLQTLPIPSAVDQLDFGYVPDISGASTSGTRAPWRLGAHMRFFTTADTSS